VAEPAFFAAGFFGFEGVCAVDLEVYVAGFFAGEVVLVVVVLVDFLGAALFLTGCFLGDEKSLDANLYIPQRIAKVTINSMIGL
jgi:hypothetical protein